MIGNSHDKGMNSDSVEGEKVVVRELDSGSRISSGMVIRRWDRCSKPGGCARGGFGDSATCTTRERSFRG
jgi:hypothetical protein